MIVEYNCKICKKPGKTQADDSCDPKWVATFKKMLTCNPCYDLRKKFRNAEHGIISGCLILNRMKMKRLSSTQLMEVTDSVRAKLMVETRRYAQAMAVYRGLSTPVWSESLVDDLMRPIVKGDIDDITKERLKNYRASLRKPMPSEIAEIRNVTADP